MKEPITALVHNASLMTVDGIIDSLRAFKDGSRNTDYDCGYDDGINQAIRAVQLFRKVMEQKQAEPNG